MKKTLIAQGLDGQTNGWMDGWELFNFKLKTVHIGIHTKT